MAGEICPLTNRLHLWNHLNQMKNYLNAEEIARLEGIAEGTVSRYIRGGLFDNVRKVAQEWRVPISSYETWRASTRLEYLPKESPNG